MNPRAWQESISPVFLRHLRELVLRPSPTGQERHVREYVKHILKERIHQDPVGNVFWEKGDSPPVLLCAHMDTVQSPRDITILREKPELTEWPDAEAPLGDNGEVQFGFDDKVGVAIILMLAESTDWDFRALFTVGEERGQIGAHAAPSGWFDGLRFSLTLDRRGSQDIVDTIYGTRIAPLPFAHWFLTLPSARGRSLVDGLASDASVLAAYAPALNLSVGYHNPHGCGDSCDVDVALSTTQLAVEAIAGQTTGG